jgi:tetrahydromethanopterin S-methyltransferase subunit F
MKKENKLSVMKKAFNFIVGFAAGLLLWGLTLLILLILN